LLLENKSYKELIQTYGQRAGCVIDFLASTTPCVACNVFCLDDPNMPTAAESNPDVQAIVVSEETLAGAVKINDARKARGFKPLVLVIVPVLGAMVEGDKQLSSTELRKEDATLAAV
jgi:pantetheine-phosphate adenylyltransferase